MDVLQYFIYVVITFIVLYAYASRSYNRKELYGDINKGMTYPCLEPLRKFEYSFLLFFFFVIIFFRFLVNPQTIPDTWYYADNFKIIGKIPWSTLLLDGGTDYGIEDERGFLILTKLIFLFVSNQNLYVGILGFCICFGYYILFKGYSQIVWLSCLLFLLGGYNQSLFVLRQYLAIVLLILSISHIIKRDLFKFLICIIIAFCIHRTAILFLPIYFLYGIEGKKRFLICSLIVVVVGRLCILALLGHILAIYADLAAYASDEDGANLKMTFFLASLLLARLFLLRKCYWNKGVNRLFTIILFCAAAFSILSYGFGFDRIVINFSTFLCVIIPQTIINIKKPIIKYIFAIVFIAVQFYLWVGSLSHLATMKFLSIL